MCSHSLKRMENCQGDLADIVRATTTTADGENTAAEVSAASDADAVIPDLQFWSNTIPYSSYNPPEDFGDPFTYMMRDPFMQKIDSPSSTGFFCNSNIINGGGEENGGINLAHKVDDEKMKRPSSIFSRMLQISPTAKLSCDYQAAAPPPLPPSLKGPPILVSNNNNRGVVENSCLQISSPRNTGVKRRKSQAKKVVCIPAPAPANSRSSGEVVPSDLWAWRKYGQKPIKGSPYPRGYYRCSSSKGCSARKQVERSRTDPNTLVITYTSEHNHPWPTQRNALAGSSRSNPSKNASKNSSPNSQTGKPTTKEINTVDENSAAVKVEMDQDVKNRFEMDEAEFDEGLLQSYKPTFADSNHSEDSFFAELGEIEADPLDLLFTQGFSRDGSVRENEDLDPFNFYDWGNNNSNTTAARAATTASSGVFCGEYNKGS